MSRISDKIILIFLLIISCLSPAALGKDWPRLYGDEIRFSIYRKDRPVGNYSVNFIKNGAETIVVSKMDLAIKVFGLLQYNYRYAAQEVWHNHSLQRLSVYIDNNGAKKEMELQRLDDSLVGHGEQGPIQVPLPIATTHHYDAEVVYKDTVFNTITGRENKVNIQFLGPERIQTASGLVDSFRYRYFGELKDTDVWYNQNKQWVKLQFKIQDGSTLKFICETCLTENAKPSDKTPELLNSKYLTCGSEAQPTQACKKPRARMAPTEKFII